MRITVRTDNNPTINIQNPSPVVSIVEAGKYKGDQVELQVNSTHIQWRYVGGTSWTNLVALSVITGETGNGISGVVLTNTNGKIKTYTITFTDETTTTFQVVDGNDGTNGDDGHSPVITFVGTVIYIDGVAGPDLKGATGAAGDNGVGISDIQFIETIGLVDYYEITLSDSSTYQFTVTNGEKGDDGKGITSITLTNTVGKTKTYTITFTDGSTKNFYVVDGSDGNDGHSPVITFVGTTIYVDGVAGPDLKGATGKSAYQSYLDTTTDNPVLSEAQWSNLFGSKENTSNKVTSIASNSTNVQYAGAKAVWDLHTADKYINVDFLKFSMQGALGAWYGSTYAALGLLLNLTTNQSDINLVTGSVYHTIYRVNFKCKVINIKVSANVAAYGIALVKYTFNMITEAFTAKEIIYLNENVSWGVIADVTNNIILNRNDVLCAYYKPSVTSTVWGRLYITLEKIFE